MTLLTHQPTYTHPPIHPQVTISERLSLTRGHDADDTASGEQCACVCARVYMCVRVYVCMCVRVCLGGEGAYAIDIVWGNFCIATNTDPPRNDDRKP